MTIQEYLSIVEKRYKAGISREHSYRGDLEALIRGLVPGVEITNEPANVTDCGNPDYVITKGKIPVGYIEAKDIGKDLNGKQYKEQFDRYKKALENLLITDYIWFQFFQDGVLVREIRIAEIEGNRIKPISENFAEFENLIKSFCAFVGQTIKSSKKLAGLMAAKARLLQDILERALTSDEETQENTSLREQYNIFKDILIHDLTPKAFADIYAQTLAYGMFAARLHDTTLDNFSRQEAAELIPKTNPFLRKLFGYVAGPDIDERIKRTVDNLADVFRATNVDALLHNFGKSTQMQDPIIHFYETFLAEYDPKLRKARGVWYTPQPVVSFIVRAVDDILKTEFGLSQGLADTTKTRIKIPVPGTNKTAEKEVHKVQILDPAAGTGTFLAEVVKHIYNNYFSSMQGAWSGYVEENLIPRLNGFELLMASYAMAHLKLDMLLTETGYKPKKEQRFRVYLTNSLEEYHPDTGNMFANWLSTEANEANHVKRDTPVMVIVGNPPYSVSSSNKSEWIEKLMIDYKKGLNERNINPLSDDYLKFIRYGQYFIEKNREGILAYISNNSFIDGIIHRQMRNSILEVFDRIYILDLHGSSKKEEKSPDGSPDQNVFDIMQGVSINILIKTSKRNKLGEVYHKDLFGKREIKYHYLKSTEFKSVEWDQIRPQNPDYFFIPKNYEVKEEYDLGFSTNELFVKGSSGIKTERDSITIQYTVNEVLSIKNELINSDVETFRQKYNERKDGRDWKLAMAKEDLIKNNPQLIQIHYRPFDIRFTNYTGKTKGFHAYPRNELSPNFIQKENLGLIHLRLNYESEKYVTLVTNTMTEKGSLVCGNYFISPLYVYSKNDEQNTIESIKRIPNLKPEIVKQIAEKLGLEFTNEKEETENTFAPIDLLDYIYAVLHSPIYREKYKEFLKIDFPRVPYPKDQETFWRLVALGGELRQIHLLESPVVEQFITTYPVDGSNIVEKPKYSDEKVWINKEQYFGGVPLVAWEFYIGGYQPAQKWLKDRKGRELSFEDILHYRKIIVALTETDRIMHEIDKIDME